MISPVKIAALSQQRHTNTETLLLTASHTSLSTLYCLSLFSTQIMLEPSAVSGDIFKQRLASKTKTTHCYILDISLQLLSGAGAGSPVKRVKRRARHHRCCSPLPLCLFSVCTVGSIRACFHHFNFSLS